MQYYNCPICRSDKIKSLKNYKKHYLSKCSDCGFVFAARIPEESELERLYNGYGNYSNLSPITIKRFKVLLKDFTKFKKNNTILDYGCGEGYFLDIARQMEWQVYGVEYDKKAAEKCTMKGIRIIDSMDQTLYGQFDVVYISEVIEHVSDPLNVLTTINNFLRIGGLVYITTPNFNSLSRFYVKDKWNIISVPEHLSYFTTGAIKKGLWAASFEHVKTKTSGISLSRIKNSLIITSTAQNNTKQLDEKIRRLAEDKYFFKALKALVNTMLNITNLGDTIKCYAIKRKN